MASTAAKSTLFETSYPQSHQQWRTTLQKIKQLYIQRQYKRCVSRCPSILSSVKEPIHPAYKVYLYFYSAPCYEAMGRYVHEYSSKKVPLLREAKDCFGVALGALLALVLVEMENDGNDAMDGSQRHCTKLFGFGLGCDNGIARLTSSSRSLSRSPSPSPSTADSEPERRSRSGSTSPAESIITSITEIIDKTLDLTDDDPFISDCEDVIGVDTDIGAQPASNAHEERKSFTSTSDSDSDLSSTNKTDLLVPSLQVRKTPSPRALVFKVPNFDGQSTPSQSPTRVQTTTHTRAQAQAQSLILASDQDQSPIMAVRPRPLPLELFLPIKTAGEGTLGSTPSTNSRTRNVRSSLGPYSCSTPTQQNSYIPVRQGSIPQYPSRTPTEKYNASLTLLQTQISSNITALQSDIQHANAIQQTRLGSRRNRSFRRSVSFWSFSPVKSQSSQSPSKEPVTASLSRGVSSSSRVSSRSESLQERIVRLRSEGWKKVGLRNRSRGWKGSEYYKEFCGMVLDELYLG
ncbi:uncharacterized protein BDV14DRAFT_48073 [Aspergillus stella-maris]|uniref:uncharacterized protein n=1 Tax=Aspergillus stella-maris TaxID=1810926 RepID=UPI003CCE185F